jgi:hypothetical protein
MNIPDLPMRIDEHSPVIASSPKADEAIRLLDDIR